MRYLAWFALPLCGGIFLAVYSPANWMIWAGALVCAILLAIFLSTRSQHRRQWLLLTAGALCGFVWTGLYTQLVVAPVWQMDGVESGFTAEVSGYPTQMDDGISVPVRVRSGLAQGRQAIFYLEEDYDFLTPGDTLAGTAEFSASAKADGTVKSYDVSAGVYLRAEAEVAFAQVNPIPLYDLPQWLALRMKEAADALFAPEESALLQGLLTGDKDGISDRVYSSFLRSGLGHLLAVSGLHVGFLISLLWAIPGGRRWRGLIAVPILLCFALMTGGSPSVWRAVMMSWLLMLAQMVDRKNDPPTTLSFVLAVMLVQNPYAALSGSLQLSFGAVAGIMLFQARIYGWLMRPVVRDRPNRRAPMRLLVRVYRFVAFSLSTSCSAVVLTLPLSAVYFDMVSLAGPVANLLVVEFAAFAFGIGLLTCCLWWVFPVLAEVIAVPVSWLLRYFLWVAEHLGSFRHAALRLDNFYAKYWLAFLCVTIVLLTLSSSLRRRAWVAVLSVGALLMMAVVFRMVSIGSPELALTVLDVGQGNCAVLSSEGVFAAVDCTGEDAGEKLVDYVLAGGGDALSLLVITHYNEEEAGQVALLLDRLPVETLALPDLEDETGTRDTLEAMARKAGTALLWLDDNETFSFGSAELELLAPVSPEDGTGGMAALCTWQDYSALFTGNLDDEGQRLLVDRERWLPWLDVLVVGRGGASDAAGDWLLSILIPRMAVVSTGGYYDYLPSQRLLRRLEEHGCVVYRTDDNGNVTIRFQ